MRHNPRPQEELDRMREISDGLPEDFDALVEKLSDPDHLVRHIAATRIGQCDDARVVDVLIQALEDENAQVRSAAALQLGRVDAISALPALLTHLSSDPSPRVRATCGVAVNGFDAPEATPGLRAAIDDPDEDVAAMACSQLAGRRDVQSIPRIRAAMDSPHAAIRRAAACSLVVMGETDDRVMEMLNDPDWDVRWWLVIELILESVADQRLVDAVERMLEEPKSKEHDARVAETAAEMQEAGMAEELSAEEAAFVESLKLLNSPISVLLERAKALLGAEE